MTVRALVPDDPRVWYAVAFDVAGGIRAWSGPHRWRRARQHAIDLERSQLVRCARVQHWMPTLPRLF